MGDGKACATRVLQRTTTLVDGAKDIEMTVSWIDGTTQSAAEHGAVIIAKEVLGNDS